MIEIMYFNFSDWLGMAIISVFKRTLWLYLVFAEKTTLFSNVMSVISFFGREEGKGASIYVFVSCGQDLPVQVLLMPTNEHLRVWISKILGTNLKGWVTSEFQRDLW